MFYIIIGLINILGFGLSYIFFKPYLRRYSDDVVREFFLILGVLSLLASFLVSYLQKKPDFFETGIKQLRTNRYVTEKVGNFQSYTYFERSFKELQSQAIFDVELHGKGNVLFVSCIMKRVGKDWRLSEVEIDKLIKDRE